ncbi:MAG: hypothetical protein ACTS5I_02570 [Rhodanobacter sp.]
MKNKSVTQSEALERISGRIVGKSVIYYDDSMQRYYVGPLSDVDDLRELMGSTDEDVARDAYSHWCAGSNHGDGYETEEEAEQAAKEDSQPTL